MEIESLNQEERTSILLVILSGILVVILAFWISFVFNFSLTKNIVMAWILTDIYMLFLILLASRGGYITLIKRVPVEVIREISKPQYIDRPLYIDRPQYIDREVIKEVPVYIQSKKIALNIPKYKFIGSEKTKRFHKKSCRLSKLIKNKFKIQSDSKSFFTKRHFKQCKVCLKRSPKHSL